MVNLKRRQAVSRIDCIEGFFAEIAEASIFSSSVLKKTFA